MEPTKAGEAARPQERRDSYYEFYKRRLGKRCRVKLVSGDELEGIMREVQATYMNVVIERTDGHKVAIRGDKIAYIEFDG